MNKLLVYTIKKYKKLILFITFVVTLSVLIANYFFLPKIYRGKAVLSPPIILDMISMENIYKKYLYDFDALYARISDESFLISIINNYPELNLTYYNLKNNLKFEPTGKTSFIVITYEDISKDRIIKFFDAILNELKTRDDNYNNYINFYTKKFDETKVDILKIEENKKTIEDRLMMLEENNLEKTIEYTILISILENINRYLLDKKYELGVYQRILSESKNYFFLNEPNILDKPVKPKKLLNTLISLISSLLLTYILFLLYEYYNGEINV